MIRPARPADLPVLQEIERAAGRAFATIGMTAIADDEPFTLEELREFQRDGNAWVATEADRAAGYALVLWVAGTPGLREIRLVEAAHGLDAWPRACMRGDLRRP